MWCPIHVLIICDWARQELLACVLEGGAHDVKIWENLNFVESLAPNHKWRLLVIFEMTVIAMVGYNITSPWARWTIVMYAWGSDIDVTNETCVMYVSLSIFHWVIGSCKTYGIQRNILISISSSVLYSVYQLALHEVQPCVHKD